MPVFLSMAETTFLQLLPSIAALFKAYAEANCGDKCPIYSCLGPSGRLEPDREPRSRLPDPFCDTARRKIQDCIFYASESVTLNAPTLYTAGRTGISRSNSFNLCMSRCCTAACSGRPKRLLVSFGS